MDNRKIIICTILLMAVVGLTLGSATALKVPTKYKTHTFTSTKTYYKTKTVKYTNIPKYGATKTLTLTGPKGSKVLIYYIQWTQVQRCWYGQDS